MRDIYIVFSATPYKMGKFIRLFTRAKFNHVSFSFDRELSDAYTFARRYIDTPFYGGLIKDSPERYFYGNEAAEIAVCRLEVGNGVYAKMHTVCTDMYKQREEYIYNFFSALGYIFKRGFPVKKAFTCVEFVSYLLSFADLRTEGFHTVDELFDLYRDSTVYAGPADFTARSGTFRKKCGLMKGLAATAASVFTLIKRI